MMRLLAWALVVGLCTSHSLFAASLTKQSVDFWGVAKDIGVVNDADNLVFVQAINPSKPGFVTQGNGEWAFALNDGSNPVAINAVAIQFNGAPALMGIPAESGTLTIGANNEIADLWTNRIYARPVVFVSLEDPNLKDGVSIVPTAPITHGNQFLFDVRQADGFGADLTGAKVHYLVAEEGWHRLADGRMLLISSAEVKHTGFTGKTIELGASFTDAVTVAQLQRPMLFKNSLGFRQLIDMEVYQGATVTSGVGDFDSIGLRLMQQNGVEATTSSTVYAGRIGFMVLGNISNIANKFKTVRDTNTNIRGGSYLTVPQTNFQYYPHSAAATPLLSKAACAEDDDVQNFCTYLSLPVDAMSRGTFDTPRMPYMNSDFEPLQMQRTLYSEIEGSWEGTAEAELAAPVTDGDGKAIVGTLARMYPNFVAARGWDHVVFGSNSYWHWFATYHYNTCVFDSMNTACVDYTPGETIVQNSNILWDASTVRYDFDDDKYIGSHPSATRAQELFISTDTGRNDRGTYYERLTPKSWEASDTLDYLKFKVPNTSKFINLDNIKAASRQLIETAAEPWQFAFIRTAASASESWCSTCEGIPTFQTGEWKSSEFKVYSVAVHSNAYYYGEGHVNGSWIRPRVDKVGKSLRVGDYLFANIPIGINVQDFYWLRSATGTRSDAEQIASGELGYQATAADGNNYVTLCMNYDNSERCGDWIKVGNIPYATDIGVRTIAPSGVDLVGDYSYIAPGSGNYDVESRSPHQWQKLTNGVWQDISGATEQTYVARGSLGWQVRFCVIPRSLAGITGPEVCSAGIVVQGDNDADGIADHWDSDDDNDGIFDWYDAFPFDRNEWQDTDRDGIGNNADLDDDNDGLSDEVELAGLTDPLKYDTDGDGTNDAEDPFPTSYGNFPDFDNDGLDDTVDDDIDGDGVVDFVEVTHNGQSVFRRVDDDPYSACLSNQITVTSNADSGPGTLRQALNDLCAGEIYSDLNVIDFSQAMTITLQSPLVIKKGVKINGNQQVILDAQGQHEVFYVAMTNGLASTQFPHLAGLTLRNGAADYIDEDQFEADKVFASAVHVHSSPYLILEHVLIENMSAPAIAGKSVDLFVENSLIANVSGISAALHVTDGDVSLFSSTVYNSEGGAISVVDTGKAQLLNSLLLKGANGSTVCNVTTWEQRASSWVEDSECGVISSGYVVLADPDNGDYRPVPGSANIDAAEAGELPPDAVDLLGNLRVMGEYNPDNPEELGGPIYPQMDIGAIEYVFAGDFDGDGVVDSADAFPNDATETTDSDNDGTGDNSDAFPNDPNEQLDTDLDGVGNNADLDDDGDNVADTDDAFPLDASEWLDTDLDGIGNNADTDDDNDNVPDAADALPLDPTETLDTDNDGIGNNADTDDDGDGVLDSNDAFPLDITEWLDTDGDGIGNNADPDDDNDGIEDKDDASPLDPNAGDTQKPEFAELAALSFEAQGEMTSVTLPLPQVSDNSGVVASLSSDIAPELALGEHIITWTATDAAGNTATAEQLVNIVDTTAPEFDALDTLEVNAIGRLTDISDLIAYSALDLVDGEVAAELTGSSELTSGAHELELVATDSSGNSASTTLSVHILPQLKLVKRMTVEAGSSYALPVLLTGEAPVYPVMVAYSLLADGQLAASLSADIAAGTNGELAISIPAGLSVTTALQVQVDSVSHAFVADNNTTTLVLTEQNMAPTFSAQVQQQGMATRLLDPLSGEAQIVLSISDVNMNDTHQVSWQIVGQAFSGIVAADSLSMGFNPAELSAGRYAVEVTVTESNTAEQFSTKQRIRFKVDALPALSTTADSDGDGIVDSLDGYGDSDGDGIADYLDNDVDSSRLPVNNSSAPMQTTTGVQLTLGSMASAMIKSGAGITMSELAEAVADDSSAADSSDTRYSQVTAVLDFTLSGQIQPGQSVGVVIPVPTGTELPADAVYRKYTPEQGWFSFVEDSRNNISSAPLNAAGECPQVEDASFEPGLVEGYHCVQLLLEDGGPNDADGSANGVIEDPGVIAVLSQNALPLAVADSAETLDTQAIIIDVLANDSDADGDSLSITAASANNGVVELLSDNTLRYTPTAGFSGVATISYQIADGFGGEALGEVRVTVSPAPVVVDLVEPAPETSGGGSLPLWLLGLLLLGVLCNKSARQAEAGIPESDAA
ncbi:cadherin-like domain-containing protein [Bowmanella sp. Y26]|uniref:Ig-like domain-containing protein n=1 Tax=Bowmanella yangjiangensis TaxID=2811230 RepID=UPI001BDBC33C|nr:Ig-like domain-containing protein [Bowmanella yangjiangensis]MBT1062475.1 cadherin-like domain-containing protein [Bowmanella yangjiangensis]